MSDTWGILSKFVRKPSATVELSNAFFNLEFDVVTSEQHSWSAEVTSNPVEDGSAVADHVKVNPDKLDISGIISNASLSRWKGEFVEKLLKIVERESNVQKAFDSLRKLLETRQPVMIYTRYRNYPDMVLTSLSIPRSKDSGDAIEFTASFQHIKRVATITVDAKEAGINPQKTGSKSVGRRAQSKANAGKTVTQPCSDSTKTEVESTVNNTTTNTTNNTSISMSNTTNNEINITK